jgi:hypothetical protein
MPSIKPLWRWLDTNLLLILAGFLLVFIPLYPKLPLFDILPGYIVRVRLEDFLVALALLVYLIQVVRRRAPFHSLLVIPIGLYLLIGLVSTASAVFVTHTVPSQPIHYGKSLLHWLRRLEYFSLYFVFYAAVRSLKTARNLGLLLGLVTLAAAIYGLGQKLYQWPVYSTMNREFAKGWRLVLTEHARVPSTFAGHYDFAAWLVLSLTLFASLLLFVPHKLIRILGIVSFVAGLSSLVMTASRASYLAYLAAISLTVFLLALRKGLFWGLSRWLGLVTVSIVMMLSFGELSDRLAHFFNLARITNYLKVDVLKLKPADTYLNLSNDLALVYTPSDQPPIPASPLLPPDVYEAIAEPFPADDPRATGGGVLRYDASGSAIIDKPRIYSDTAFAFGLSSAIRFDALWPRAIQRWLTNPLLGSGYATLTAEKIGIFTEAESTDNDYLRALGETGLLGFLSFYGIIFIALRYAWIKRQTLTSPTVYALVTGIATGTIGLLINATYIDVFEASKVAFTFWALIGLMVATIDRA